VVIWLPCGCQSLGVGLLGEDLSPSHPTILYVPRGRPGGMNERGACSPVSAPIPYPPVSLAGVRSP
jgi:hypothetical protein